MNITIGIIAGVAFLGFAYGLLKMITEFEERNRYIILSIVCGGALVVCLYGATSISEKNEETVKLTLIEMFDVSENDLIIEDLTETKVFGPSKNLNLRRVYVNNKVYIVEIEQDEIKSIVLEKE